MRNFEYQIYHDLKHGKIPEIRKLYESGGRYSGKTYALLDLVRLFFLKIEGVEVRFLKREGTELQDLWRDIKSVFADYLPNPKKFINEQQKTITYYGNFLKVYTMNDKFMKSPKVGLASRGKSKYMIFFADDCYTLDFNYTVQFVLGCRTENIKYMLEIYTWNTWNSANKWVKFFDTELPADIKKLETKGYQFKRKGDIIYFRNNYRDNPYIKPEVVSTVEKLKYVDYEGWKTTSLGLSGNTTGGCYSTSLQYLRPFDNDTTNRELRIGIDWGSSTLENGGKTSVQVLLVDPWNTKIDVVDELYLDNFVEHLSDKEIIDICVKFCGKFVSEKFNTIPVWVDNAATQDFYALFSESAKHQGIPGLYFKPINSDTKQAIPILYRVAKTNWMIANGQLGINAKCVHLLEDLQSAHYVLSTTTGEMRRAQIGNHALNAFEYGVNYLFKRVQGDLFTFKGGTRWKF